MTSLSHTLPSDFEGWVSVLNTSGTAAPHPPSSPGLPRPTSAPPRPALESPCVPIAWPPCRTPASTFLSGVRIPMLPVGLGGYRSFVVSRHGSFGWGTTAGLVGGQAPGSVAQVHTSAAENAEVKAHQQGALIPGPRVDLIPVAALLAEAIRRHDIGAARGLLRGLREDDPLKTKWTKVLRPPTAVRVAVRDRDRTAEYRALAVFRPQYRRQWVALVGDGVVASAQTLAELQEKLRVRRPIVRPLVHFFD